MRAIRAKDTKPEIAIRSGLHARGYRFRLHVGGLPGRPDVLLPKYATAIQIRGCFWHGHQCMKGRIPQSNRAYWEKKLSLNSVRDRRNDRRLQRMGWQVLVVWECQIAAESQLKNMLDRLEHKLTRNVAAPSK